MAHAVLQENEKLLNLWREVINVRPLSAGELNDTLDAQFNQVNEIQSFNRPQPRCPGEA